jgi:hypothetical protein
LRLESARRREKESRVDSVDVGPGKGAFSP